MPRSQTTAKAGFVTLCQQLLALGVVLAALVPATNIVSLDIVREQPGGGDGASSPAPYQGALSAYVREAQHASRVPTVPVDPQVTEIPLTPALSASGLAARTAVSARTTLERTAGGLARVITSQPAPVVGYGAVGVTWAHGENRAENALGFQVRTRSDGTWSKWIALDYHDDHGPDDGSAEARHARPGTDPLLIGRVDDVQVRATAQPGVSVPDDMSLAVIDPGTARTSTEEHADIDTASMDGDTGADSIARLSSPGESTQQSTQQAAQQAVQTSDGAITPSAAVFTPKPVIYSRAQWGADESLRQKSSLHYDEVHAGFVHHTATANGYSRADVPGIIRAIYAYHTKSRGWSDIGYNFLVDRFGRIWEGRYGGVDRPVVGAHTLGYNNDSFAMSAIGNYEETQPSAAMVQAYGALFAWKLSLHGVDAASTKQWVTKKYFEAINGHRDAGQTACPGKYLYAQLPKIRELAEQIQQGWSGRDLESNLASTPYPDLVTRRASDGELFIVPTGGLSRFLPGRQLVPGFTPGAQRVQVSDDLTGDGVPDLVVTTADGTVEVHPGSGQGGFESSSQTISSLAGYGLVTAAGDLNGDGHPDLVGRDPSTGRATVLLGRAPGASKSSGKALFKKRKLGADLSGVKVLASAGDLDGDGRSDLVSIESDGTVAWRRAITGNNGPGFSAPTPIAGLSGAWTSVSGRGDFNGDGHDDLVLARDNGAVYVAPGRGDGTVGHLLGSYSGLRNKGELLGGGNLIGSSAADLITRKGDSLMLFANSGRFDAGTPIDTGVAVPDANLVMNAGDWDRDGHADVIVRSRDGSLSLLRGDGDGGLAAPVKLATGFKGVALLAAVGDMTGDGYPDLMGQPTKGSMMIYPGRGASGFGTAYVAHSRIDATRQIAVGRWNSDGSPDTMLRKGNSLALYPGNGPGGLMNPAATGLDLTPYDWVVGISAPTLSGPPALVVRARSTGDLYLIRGTSSGFAAPRFLGEGMEGFDLAG